MSVLLLGTLDTKGIEFGFVRDQLQTAGVPVLLADAGVLGPPQVKPDLSREAFYSRVGVKVQTLQQAADRGQAIQAAETAAVALAQDLHREGCLSGVLGLGGSAGTTIGTAAMRAVPVGVPKVMVSTLASGDVRNFVGTRDIFLLYSVVDIAGLNRISRKILSNAAAAMIGLVQNSARTEPVASDKPVIAATMFGVTTPCVEAARAILEAAGYEVLVFHATGSGGRTMEGLIRDGLIAGVLDITTTELADERVGGILSAGPDRLTAAAMVGIPQVISVGALDMVNFGPANTVPERFQGRRFYQHNANVTLMRTTPEENDALGQEIANKACAAKGPTAVLLPLSGVSAIDAPGKPFAWPEADAALFQSLRNWTYGVDLIEIDAHINDEIFARTAAETLLQMLRRTQPVS
jgi:uncharacterized protein (UPF0261 family)